MPAVDAREDELLRLQQENARLKKDSLDKGEQVKKLGEQIAVHEGSVSGQRKETEEAHKMLAETLFVIRFSVLAPAV